MDASRISFGEMVAAVSGAVLILVMFVFSWFSYEGAPDGFDYNAWEWMSFLDIVLFLCALVAIVMAALRAAGEMPELPAPPGQIVAAAGALAVLVVLFRLVFPGDGPLLDELAAELVDDAPDATRKIGAFLGLIAAGGIVYGGYTAMTERASGAAPGTGAARRRQPSRGRRSRRRRSRRSQPPPSDPPA